MDAFVKPTLAIADFKRQPYEENIKPAKADHRPSAKGEKVNPENQISRDNNAHHDDKAGIGERSVGMKHSVENG